MSLLSELYGYICSGFQVKMWVKELKRMLGDDVYLLIIGNKVDLERNRNVDINEATGFVFFFLRNSLFYRFHSFCERSKGFLGEILDIRS